MALNKQAMRRKKPITDEHFVPADDAQAARLKFAEQKLSLARFTGQEVEEAQAELETVQAEVRETGLSFKIVSVGRLRWEQLLREHPPTDEQKAEHDSTFNADTFWPALFAEAIEGELSPEDWVEDFFDSENWGPAEIKELRDKVMTAHTSTRVAELGN